MKNYWVTVGAVFGFLAVAIGAFGAHQLKDMLSPQMMDNYKTGVLYHLVHAIIITSIGFYSNSKYFKAALFFSIGIILFSFSLYIYSISGFKPVVIITPIGGMSFLTGWFMVIISSFKKE
ncbi:MAG: DUF423 domain-containing protein [Ignavibacteria bacterium]|nr:DUF423 domain-containing protein [Ignavibacteria bacterium]